MLPTTPSPTSPQKVFLGSGAITPARRAISSNIPLARVNRKALKGSGESGSSANLLTLKLPPQIRATTSISRS